jgi:hypothetical protein
MAGHCAAGGGLVNHDSLDDAFLELLQTHPELRALQVEVEAEAEAEAEVEAEVEAVAASHPTSADRPDRRPPPDRGIVATRCVPHPRRELPAPASNRDPIRPAQRRVCARERGPPGLTAVISPRTGAGRGGD